MGVSRFCTLGMNPFEYNWFCSFDFIQYLLLFSARTPNSFDFDISGSNQISSSHCKLITYMEIIGILLVIPMLFLGIIPIHVT